MTQSEFRNALLILFSIDRRQLPELSEAQQGTFMHNPVMFFLRCDDTQAAAIWREIEKRGPKVMS